MSVSVRVLKCVCVCAEFKVTSSLRLKGWHAARADMFSVTHVPALAFGGLNLSHSHPVFLPINIWLLLDPIKRLIHRMGTCSVVRVTMCECICIMYEQPPTLTPLHLQCSQCSHVPTVPTDRLTNLSVIKPSAYFIKALESTVSDVLSHWYHAYLMLRILLLWCRRDQKKCAVCVCVWHLHKNLWITDLTGITRNFPWTESNNKLYQEG